MSFYINKLLAVLIVIVSQSFAAYNVGDTISVEHQNMEFSYCYPSDSTASFSFSKNENKIILLEMSASW